MDALRFTAAAALPTLAGIGVWVQLQPAREIHTHIKEQTWSRND
jgi:hypothetical protein